MPSSSAWQESRESRSSASSGLTGSNNLARSQSRIAVTGMGERFSDFLDTAAALQSLDLVISPDTSLGHLAGALGVPVWLALSYAPDWRWLQDRADSPWYPTMRLFRQERWGDWRVVFERMAAELRVFVRAREGGTETSDGG